MEEDELNFEQNSGLFNSNNNEQQTDEDAIERKNVYTY